MVGPFFFPRPPSLDTSLNSSYGCEPALFPSYVPCVSIVGEFSGSFFSNLFFFLPVCWNFQDGHFFFVRLGRVRRRTCFDISDDKRLIPYFFTISILARSELFLDHDFFLRLRFISLPTPRTWLLLFKTLHITPSFELFSCKSRLAL